MFTRRVILQAGVGAAAAAAAATTGSVQGASTTANTTPPFAELDLRFAGKRQLSRRALVLVPRGLTDQDHPAGLILLHGLAETANEQAGTRAWVDRYGLLDAHRRLLQPPIVPTSRRGDLPDERAGIINDRLREKPYAGKLVFVCPYIPNVYRFPSTASALDQLADWLDTTLIPEVRARTPVADGAIGIDGCSLGGYVGLEMLIRKPERFRSWGGVQSAISKASAPTFASKVAACLQTRPIPLHVETSSADPYKDANIALARELVGHHLPCELEVFPGPHDQPWLREVGTLGVLLFHDRALRSA